MFHAAKLVLVEVGSWAHQVGLVHDSERADRPTDLVEVVLALGQLLTGLAHQEKRAELGLVIREVDAFILAVLEEGVGSGDRDIIHSDLALMASSHSELTMLLSEGHDMDRTARVFL